ncbi:MAG: hypothetical protein COT14_00245 [Candidatus Diapherotrites archaeon CG08_land_8_20_14_0_20_30_16]|nr:MAG: hypothetical protein COT14_00245 [Candidatus Diapherotrites archaeon CG08_land_8_20_14_0_20_30_16]
MTQQIVNQDYVQSNGLQVVLQQLSETNETELVEQIFALSDRPEVLGLLIYKLMLERKHTNELMEGLNKKYDSLLKILEQKQGGNSLSPLSEQEVTDIEKLFLTDQDKSILRQAKGKDWISAKDIKDSVGYKGLNAASQRLNKLHKEGYLEKQRIGQQVVFVLSSKYTH